MPDAQPRLDADLDTHALTVPGSGSRFGSIDRLPESNPSCRFSTPTWSTNSSTLESYSRPELSAASYTWLGGESGPRCQGELTARAFASLFT